MSAPALPRSVPEFARYRIWDCYGSLPRPAAAEDVRAAGGGALDLAVAETLRQMDRFGIERFCPLLTVAGAGAGRNRSGGDAAEIRRCLERWPDRLLGIATLEAASVEKCLAELNRWIGEGPMMGVFFPSSAQNVVCTHPNYDPLVRRAHELGAVIFQHTWFKTGGKDTSGESTPAELAELARRHPEITLVCVHAGGEWEKGLRAVRDCGNIVVETSGFDPTAGFLEMAVRELGAERIIYGGHFPGRSFGTELAKVFGANLSERERRLILGGNFRRLLERILQRKGRALT